MNRFPPPVSRPRTLGKSILTMKLMDFRDVLGYSCSAHTKKKRRHGLLHAAMFVRLRLAAYAAISTRTSSSVPQ